MVGILSGMVTFALSFALKLKFVLNEKEIVLLSFDSFCVEKYHSHRAGRACLQTLRVTRARVPRYCRCVRVPAFLFKQIFLRSMVSVPALPRSQVSFAFLICVPEPKTICVAKVLTRSSTIIVFPRKFVPW